MRFEEGVDILLDRKLVKMRADLEHANTELHKKTLFAKQARVQLEKLTKERDDWITQTRKMAYWTGGIIAGWSSLIAIVLWTVLK